MVDDFSPPKLISISATLFWLVTAVAVVSAALAVSLRDRRITLVSLSFAGVSVAVLIARLEQWGAVGLLAVMALLAAGAALSKEAKTASTMRALFGVPISLQTGVGLFLGLLTVVGLDWLITRTDTWQLRRSAVALDPGLFWQSVFGSGLPVLIALLIIPALLLAHLIRVRAEKQ